MESQSANSPLQNIGNISGAGWAKVLDQAVATKGKFQGRSVIALDTEKNIQVFSSKSEAKQAGFGKELSMAKIISTTKALIGRSGDSQSKMKAAVSLVHLGSSEGRSGVEKSALKLAKTLFPDLANSSVEELEHVSQQIENAINISSPNKRSHNQVFFVDTDVDGSFETLVVKNIKNPSLVTTADKFYSMLGFVTPKSVAILNDGAISESLNAKLPDFLDKLPENVTSRWNEGADENSHILVMTIVEGKAANQLRPSEIALVMESEVSCRQIGKMLIADAFTGNWDRVSEQQCNTGNFMLQIDIHKGDRQVALIDHEFGVTKDSYSTLSNRQKMLLDDNQSDRVINQLYGKLAMKSIDDDSGQPLLTEQIRNMGRPWIKEGIRKGAQEIINVFSTRNDYKAFLVESGLGKNKNIDVKSMLKLYDELKEIVQ